MKGKAGKNFALSRIIRNFALKNERRGVMVDAGIPLST